MEIIKILGGLLIPVIAGLAAYIAWEQKNIAFQQKKLTADKLKLELFDRRFKIYRTANDYILQLLNDIRNPFSEDGQQIDFTNHLNFNLATKEAPFLFDEDVMTYLNLLREKSVLIIRAYNACKDHANFKMYTPERNEKIEEWRRAYDWFIEEVNVLEKHFDNYLGFKHLK